MSGLKRAKILLFVPLGAVRLGLGGMEEEYLCRSVCRLLRLL